MKALGRPFPHQATQKSEPWAPEDSWSHDGLAPRPVLVAVAAVVAVAVVVAALVVQFLLLASISPFIILLLVVVNVVTSCYISIRSRKSSLPRLITHLTDPLSRFFQALDPTVICCDPSRSEKAQRHGPKLWCARISWICVWSYLIDLLEPIMRGWHFWP